MASAVTPGGPVVSPQQYWCYQCNRNVYINPSPSLDLLCPNCNGGFLEEQEDTNRNPNPISESVSPFPSTFAAGLGGFPLVFSTSSGSMDIQSPTDIAGLLGHHRSGSGGTVDPDVFNPFNFLQNYLNSLMAGGASIQFVLENNPSDGAGAGFRFPANLGDYFIGPGLEQLIQQLAENDPNRYGTPPAAKSAIDSLPNIRVSEELLETDSAQCAVCKETFEQGSDAKQMPCKHIYHSDCIIPWLAMHNSCPVCRYELPTDDPDYEHRTRDAPVPPNQAAPAGSGSGSSETGQDNAAARTDDRRFRISLPWPFRFGSMAETSNSSVGRNDNIDHGNNDGESNSRNQGNPGLGNETRQEDLD
ncbi:E3 ubiquitin-protein ligase RING1-like [Aristolochia californica]|uniref:E3 ubiquitin-protein ligase RING1-like n=1 Tax=Aristolochia californica TaxID=171875 RepID=UPI0035D780AE